MLYLPRPAVIDEPDPHRRIEQLLGPCPVSKDDERYQSWLDVGFVLLEAHSRFQAEFIERSFGADTDELAALAIEATVRQFDIIASMIALTATDYASAVRVENSLTEASTAVLTWLQRTIGKGPRWMRENISVPTAKARLQQRVAHWTAKTLQIVRESQRTVSEPPKAAPPVELLAPPVETALETFPERAVWLQEQLDARSWTVHDIERYNGPDWRTVRKILAGLPVKETVLEKLAQALSQKAGTVRLGDVPRA